MSSGADGANEWQIDSRMVCLEMGAVDEVWPFIIGLR